MAIHLVIPDQHAHPDHANERFEWLGKLIVDLRPDVIVNLGDMADMPSLCSYDKGTKGFEGRRYKKDIEVTLDAQERMFTPIKKAKKKRGRYVFCVGNHEERINRATSADAVLDGTISLDDLHLKEHGWEVIDFLRPVVVDGIAYSHYFTSGVMGRPVGGENPAKTLLNKQHMSVTAGHTHTLDFASTTTASGQRIMGLVAGAYVDHESGWNNPQSEALWWSGVVIKRHVEDGSYDPQFVSIEALRKEYGTVKRGKSNVGNRTKRAKVAHR
jgi:3',5'-cyclic AMP phosphodiesterase CpdA